MEKSSPLKSSSRSAAQIFLVFYETLNPFPCSQNPWLTGSHTETNLVHTLINQFFNRPNQIKIVLPSTPKSFMWFPPSMFSYENVACISYFCHSWQALKASDSRGHTMYFSCLTLVSNYIRCVTQNILILKYFIFQMQLFNISIK